MKVPPISILVCYWIWAVRDAGSVDLHNVLQLGIKVIITCWRVYGLEGRLEGQKVSWCLAIKRHYNNY